MAADNSKNAGAGGMSLTQWLAGDWSAKVNNLERVLPRYRAQIHAMNRVQRVELAMGMLSAYDEAVRAAKRAAAAPLADSAAWARATGPRQYGIPMQDRVSQGRMEYL